MRGKGRSGGKREEKRSEESRLDEGKERRCRCRMEGGREGKGFIC